MLSEKDKDALIEWRFADDTGVSSQTIAAIALGLPARSAFGFDRPHDSGDFGRCYRLVKKVPALKEYFPEVAKQCPEFGPIIEAWDELSALYEQDMAEQPVYELVSRGRGRRKVRMQVNQRACYDRIKQLGDACMIAGGWTKTGYGWVKENA